MNDWAVILCRAQGTISADAALSQKRQITGCHKRGTAAGRHLSNIIRVCVCAHRWRDTCVIKNRRCLWQLSTLFEQQWQSAATAAERMVLTELVGDYVTPHSLHSCFQLHLLLVLFNPLSPPARSVQIPLSCTVLHSLTTHTAVHWFQLQFPYSLLDCSKYHKSIVSVNIHNLKIAWTANLVWVSLKMCCAQTTLRLFALEWPVGLNI